MASLHYNSSSICGPILGPLLKAAQCRLAVNSRAAFFMRGRAAVPMRAFCRWPVFRHVSREANWASKKRFESARPPFPAARYTGFMQSLPVQSLDGLVAWHSCYEPYAVGQRC
jgi:hypothetical protein